MSFEEVLQEYRKLEERMEEHMAKTRQENYTNSYHYSASIFNEGVDKV
jgi:hypothetical protein